MKNSKKRIYRPRDYMKAMVISLLIGIMCIAITLPILKGALEYKGIQDSINLVALDAQKYGWTDGLTKESQGYEAKREEMAKENAVVNWCYQNSKTTFCVAIRNINVVIFALVFAFGVSLTIFISYCIGRDVRQCGIPYIVNLWKRANDFAKNMWKNAKMPKAEKTRNKCYKQFGIEAK